MVAIDNIRTGLWPTLFLARVYGLVVFEYPAGRLRPLLSLFYIVTKWIAYSVATYYFLTWYPRIVNNNGKITHILKLCHLCAVIFSTFLGIYFSKSFQYCLNNLETVDDTLEKLGVPKEYPKLFKITFVIMTGWLVVYLTFILQNAKRNVEYYKSFLAALVPYLEYYPLFISTTSEVSFMILLGCTASRFSRINQCIEELVHNEKYPEKSSQDISYVNPIRRDSADVENCKHTIQILMQLHLQLRKICRKINNSFEIQLWLGMFCYFTMLSKVLIKSFQFLTLLKQNALINVFDLVSTHLWGCIIIAKLVCINSACEIVRDKAVKTKEMISKLMNTVPDEEVRKDSKQFRFQLLQKPLQFTILGLFTLGYDFIQNFISFQTTVLIIILQITLTPNMQHVRKN